MTTHDRIKAAYHEAGHTVMALSFGRPVLTVSLEKMTVGEYLADITDPLYDARIKLAGPLANRIKDNALEDDSYNAGGILDYIQATSLIEEYLEEIGGDAYDDDALEALQAQQEQFALDYLREHWHQVEALALALLDRGQLTRPEAQQVIQEARR
jgi:hypothetical protein